MRNQFSFILILSFLFSCFQASKITIPVDSKKKATEPRDVLASNLKNRDKPRVNVEGAEMSVLVENPDIVTPTGIAVDNEDRIYVIENHTHVRRENYSGPDVDRLLIFEGYLDENPNNQKVYEYATDFKDGMSLRIKENGQVLIATRASIIQFTDSDNDFIADTRDTLIGLDTKEKFSHNGMSGLAIGPDNKIYFQCGENFGSEYLMTGTDGTSVLGEEREGGSIYRCDMDGSNLERIGTAIWNCFGMNFDPYGNLFSVENDPDSHPPCRLLHVVKGGNYGFEFNHGRDGLSPLTSWFGQIPGTLPMVSGTGEAPCGLVHYDSGLFGPKVQSSLLVASWGDSVIQSFNLISKDGSFTAKPFTFIEGKRNFAPVDIAIDSKGGLIISDWASLAYPVHGKGKIWRISPPNNDKQKVQNNDQIQLLNSPYVNIRNKVASEIVSSSDNIIGYLENKNIKDIARPNILWAAANINHPQLKNLLMNSLKSKNELIRSLSVNIMLEKNLTDDENFYLNLFQNDPSIHVKRKSIYGLKSHEHYKILSPYFKEKQPFIHTAIIEIFGKPHNINMLLEFAESNDSSDRLGALLCLRRAGADLPYNIMKKYLFDPDYTNRQVALRWISEDRLVQFRDIVEESFISLNDINQKIFDAYLVAFQYLDGKWDPVIPRMGPEAADWGDEKATPHFAEGDVSWQRSPYKRQPFLFKALGNKNFSSNLKARALAAMDPFHADLTVPFLMQLFNNGEEDLRIEVLRTLSVRITDPEACKTVQKIAKNKSYSINTRLEAVSALGSSASVNQISKNSLLQILSDNKENTNIKTEAYKNLISFSADLDSDQYNIKKEKSPVSLAEWRTHGNQAGDEKAGSRIFFSSRYQCGSCHRVDGRGGIYGQDLSKVGMNANRSRIIESILKPSDIISPEYVGYEVTTKEEETYVGREDKDHDSKYHLSMILANGERKMIRYTEIEEQKILNHSLMPSGLYEAMSPTEFRDLVEFLSNRKD